MDLDDPSLPLVVHPTETEHGRLGGDVDQPSGCRRTQAGRGLSGGRDRPEKRAFRPAGMRKTEAVTRTYYAPGKLEPGSADYHTNNYSWE